MSKLSDCTEIELRVIPNPAGNLAVIEPERDLPFEIRRVYYLYSVPDDGRRGGHAHRRLREVLIPVAGRFDVVLDDARDRRTMTLDTPDTGLYVPTMIWRELVNFTTGAVCLVLAADPYDEGDYIRDYREFVAERGA